MVCSNLLAILCICIGYSFQSLHSFFHFGFAFVGFEYFFALLDDGTFYFDEKSVDASQGPISTSASVIRGLTSFAASESTGLNVCNVIPIFPCILF